MVINIVLALFLSEATILQELRTAGFTESESKVMLCVAKWESSYNAHAIHENNNGSKDLGLFQINDKVWKSKCSLDKLMDYQYNIKCARIVFEKQGLDAWVGYKLHKEECDGKTAPVPRETP